MTGGAQPLSVDSEHRISFLRSVEVLSGVRTQWLEELASRLTETRLLADEILFQAGEPADALYVVRTGRVAVFTDTSGRPVRLIERADPGRLLGLVGALGGSQRAASVRALRPTTLLRLARPDLLRMLEKDSTLGLRFTLAVVSRHTRNAAAALELGDRREIRVRIGRQVDLVIGHGNRLRANIENLSLGGICLGEVSPDSFPETPTWYFAHLPDGNQVLSFQGRVAWRRGRRIGLTFVHRAPGHDLLIQGALRQLLQLPNRTTPLKAHRPRRPPARPGQG